MAMEARVAPTIYAVTYSSMRGKDIRLEVQSPKDTKGFTLPPLVSIVQKIIKPRIKLCESASWKGVARAGCWFRVSIAP
jgi:hypothetical protein